MVAVPDLIGRYLMAPAVRWKLVGLKPTYRTRLALYLMAPAVRWKLEPALTGCSRFGGEGHRQPFGGCGSLP